MGFKCIVTVARQQLEHPEVVCSWGVVGEKRAKQVVNGIPRAPTAYQYDPVTVARLR